jgi:hypothetical protein
MNKTTFIYALLDPDTRRIRYVGKADDPEFRYRKHLVKCKEEKNHRATWLRFLKTNGKKPILEVLDEVLHSEWGFWEREYIRLFRILRFDLVNATDGGDCGPVHRGPDNVSYGKPGAMRGKHPWNFGKKASLETRLKMSLARRGEKNGMFGKTHTPEARAIIGAASIQRFAKRRS